MTDTLKLRQRAAEVVEEKMIKFLLQYSPAEELTVRDIRGIALYARNMSFETFSGIETS